MSGGSRPKVTAPQKMDPVPSPAPAEEMIRAKDKVKSQAKKKGRSSTILADRMMQRGTLNFGKQKVGA